jgi:hypothetical protein
MTSKNSISKKVVNKLWFTSKMVVFGFMVLVLLISLKTVERLSCIETTDKMYMILVIMITSFWLIKQFWNEIER